MVPPQQFLRMRDHRPGFTLFELFLAMMIFVLSIIYVSNMFSTSNRTLGGARDEAIAFELCVEGVEWFSNMPFDRVLAIVDDSEVRSGFEGRLGIAINQDFKEVAPFTDDKSVMHQYYDKKMVNQQFVEVDYIRKKFQRKIDLKKVGDEMITISCQVRFLNGKNYQTLEISSLVVAQFLAR